MYTTRNLFWVSLIGSILIFLIGVELKINEKMSGGYLFSKSGNIGYNSISGTSVIFLSVLVFLFSLWTYRLYKNELLKRDDKIQKEKVEDKKNMLKKIQSSTKVDMNLFLFNRKEFNEKYNIKK